MKRLLLIVLAVIVSLHLFSQAWIKPEEAVKHRGETVNLIGFATTVIQVTNKRGPAVLISLKTNNSKQSLTVLLPTSDRAKSKEAESAYLNQYVQVRGIVEMHSRHPQIILDSEKQITIARDAAPEEE